MDPTDSKASRRCRHQAQSYAELLHRLCADAFRSGKPADRILAACFRADKKYGSSDRRLISETYFGIFRWWGWLRHAAGTTPFDRDWADAGPWQQQWTAVLAAVHLLDSERLQPVAALWLDAAAPGLGAASLSCVGNAPLAAKADAVMPLLAGYVPAWEDLAPPWFWQEIPCAPENRQALVTALQRRPPMWLRLQTRAPQRVLAELQQAGLDVDVAAACPDAVRILRPRVNLYQLRAFRAGAFEVQDFSSQCIGQVCAACPGERWWDVCAGAGGKSLQLAAQMENRGTVVATDVRGWKLQDLRKRARRARLHNISAKPWNGRQPPARRSGFDGVLVDAPCSCSGTWRRNPDGRWTTRAEDVAEMAATQGQILRRAAAAVRPGGVLVYATCSMCRRENDDVVRAFLADHDAFGLEPFAHPLTGTPTDGMLHVHPLDADSDAAFVARLRRREKTAG